MTAHTAAHDPILMHAECSVCNHALRIAFNMLAGLNLGPRTVDVLVERIRFEAQRFLAEGPAA